MRLGKWVDVYKEKIPIPQSLRMAFGLTEGSQLHLAPIHDSTAGSVELIVSPVPVDSWISACRLSVRLTNNSGALAKATGFLRQRKINILLTEASVTYQHRAHWDAICDLGQTEDFSRLERSNSTAYKEQMLELCGKLTQEFYDFLELPENQDAFLRGPHKHADFSPLTGLNDSAFAVDYSWVKTLAFHNGGIELPLSLIKYISGSRLNMQSLPSYAIVTGNTEQRYLRIYFIRDFANMFRAIISNRLIGLSGGGIGVLNQFLAALPKEINLFKMSNYIEEKHDEVERGRIDIIGHWPHPSENAHSNLRLMREDFSRIVEKIEIYDSAGLNKGHLLKLEDFHSPVSIYPRVFVSYSTTVSERLEPLLTALRASDFHPVLGTDYNYANRFEGPSRERVTPGVTDNAFSAMRGCVAFISLQVKCDEFCVTKKTSSRTNYRYLVPPWLIAEEVFAWSRDIGMLVRLREAGVEDPRYKKDILTFEFEDDPTYDGAIQKVVETLINFRSSPLFEEIALRARKELYGPDWGSEL